ncbi:DUF2306 domain-containing protein [Streptomyces sp. NPDC048717]|uniref:DUF2306 domain-containing protein n=1 Tax=Streptomyces sp. NPDC048717 TaxID=3154928 RepID=UPI003413AABA
MSRATQARTGNSTAGTTGTPGTTDTGTTGTTAPDDPVSPTGPAGKREGVRWGRAAALVVTVVCLLYAPVAMTGLWPFARPGAPSLGQWLLGRSVSPGYAATLIQDRAVPYARSLGPLIVHSVLGGLLMLLGPAQLLTAVRRRIRLHRTLGILYAAAVYVSMAGVALYLIRTRPEETFSGAAFWVVLATLLTGTVLSVTFGILTAVAGLPELHQRWMLLCYAYLMTAPLLRIEWGALPALYPGLTLQEINLVALMPLGTFVVLGALLASRAMDRRHNHPFVSGRWWPAPVLAAAYAVAVAGLAWLGHGFAGHGTPGRRLLLAYAVPYVLLLAVPQVRALRAARRGAVWAREEWHTHLVVMCLAPAFSAGTAVMLQRAMDVDELTALTAGAGLSAGFLAFGAHVLVGARVLYGRRAHGRRTGPSASRTATATATAATAAPGLEREAS